MSSDTDSTDTVVLSTKQVGYQAEKQSHRDKFAVFCRNYADNGFATSDKILYTETREGLATATFLKHDFREDQLYPCNDGRKDPDAMKIIKERYPGVHCRKRDIVEQASRHIWLGVWFDMEGTWTYPKSGEWKYDKLPKFNRARVCAVTLCTSRSGMQKQGPSDMSACDIHAAELGELFKKSKGFDCSSSEPHSYISWGLEKRMLFGIAIFQPKERKKGEKRKHEKCLGEQIVKHQLTKPTKSTKSTKRTACKESDDSEYDSEALAYERYLDSQGKRPLTRRRLAYNQLGGA